MVDEMGGKSRSPVLVDDMDNKCSKAFAALPERLYIIREGKIIYQGGMGPYFYSIKELEDQLKKLV